MSSKAQAPTGGFIVFCCVITTLEEFMIAECIAENAEQEREHLAEIERCAHDERLSGRCDSCQEDGTIGSGLRINGGLAMCKTCNTGDQET